MNHFTDRQRQAVISAGDEKTCQVVDPPFVADMWVEAAGTSVSVAEPKHENKL